MGDNTVLKIERFIKRSALLSLLKALITLRDNFFLHESEEVIRFFSKLGEYFTVHFNGVHEFFLKEAVVLRY